MESMCKSLEVHEIFMREALKLVDRFMLRQVSSGDTKTCTQADLALQSDEIPVGCVFVNDGRVLAGGMNATNKSLNVSFR